MATDDRRVTAFVYEHLREEILAGALGAGDRLDQEPLAARFDVSRTPVREALLRLEADGLVERVPYRGALVRPIDPAWVEEVYALRLHLEGLAARLGASRITDEALTKMGVELKALDRATSTTARGASVRNVSRANQRFHHVLYEAAAAPELVRLIEPLQQHAQRIRSHFKLERLPVVVGEHGAIYAAAERRDGNAAETLTRHHILTLFVVMTRRGLRRLELRYFPGVLRPDELSWLEAQLAVDADP
jgi:DNA-binding GntR family transcriptional regulator